MVCDRCIKVLSTELQVEGIRILEIRLGKIRLEYNPEQDERLLGVLKDEGFSLITSPQMQLVEEVKIELIKLTKNLPVKLNKNLSSYLEKKLNHEYSKISKVFSATEKVTIEKYFIRLKTERVKELIERMEYNFTQISQLLDYGSLNHLSGQFKNETGMSLTEYKEQRNYLRNSLDKII